MKLHRNVARRKRDGGGRQTSVGVYRGRDFRRQKKGKVKEKNALEREKIHQKTAGEKTRAETTQTYRFKMLLGSKVTFLLVVHLCVMECVRSTSVSPALLQPPLTRVRIIEVEDDYDEEISKTTLTPQSPGVTTPRVIPRPCDYDPCVAQTTPCEKLSALTGCLCPGLTGPDERPEPPKLHEVKADVSGEVVVYWCAPRSNVTYYEVTMKGREKPHIFKEYLRNGVIPGLNVGETVCVAAGNQAGLSEKSCTRYEPLQPDRASLSAGIIAGSVGFLLLISVLAVVLWRRRTCRKSGMGDGEGLGNPSYTNDGAL